MEPTRGTRFGRWVVLEDREYRSKTVLCRCDCGTEKPVGSTNLRGGLSTSCGCLRNEKTSARFAKHGSGYKDYRYVLWKAIKAKCFTPTSQDYSYYGARGITMHPGWIHDFPAFAQYIDETLGARPDGRTLDRINNDGNYEPGNLRWATRREQALNRRNRWRFKVATESAPRVPRQKHHRAGEDSLNAKLTLAQVQDIRTRYIAKAASQTALAREYGISQPQVSRIIRGTSWQG